MLLFMSTVTSCNAHQSYLPQNRLGFFFSGGGGGGGGSVLSITHTVTKSRCASYGELTVFVRDPTAGKIHEGTS